MSSKPFIYMDNAATTAVGPEVFEEMKPWFCENFGNPSSIYAKGRESAKAIIKARTQVAQALGCQPAEIIFTGCGTESDNWALKGAMALGKEQGKCHMITTVFEHHAILHTAQDLEKQGFEVTYLPVYEDGIVRIEDLEQALRPDTALVSIMYANNEIGTIQPIAQIGKLCRERGVLFHTDAVQAVGHVDINLGELCVDMLSLSGHKINAPKGVGALYLRKGVRLPNLLHGGGQEGGKRAGTENLASIVGLGRAIEIAAQNLRSNHNQVLALREQLIDELLKIPHSRLNGHRQKRLPGNVNISFVGVEGESLLLMLDNEGVMASSGSACTSGSLDPSHVLLSLGLAHEVAHGSLRLSVGPQNTKEDVEHVIRVLPKVVERLRAMSPMWERIVNNQPII